MIFDPAIFDPAVFDAGALLASRHWPLPELRPVPWRQPIIQLDDTDAEWLLLLEVI